MKPRTIVPPNDFAGCPLPDLDNTFGMQFSSSRNTIEGHHAEVMLAPVEVLWYLRKALYAIPYDELTFGDDRFFHYKYVWISTSRKFVGFEHQFSPISISRVAHYIGGRGTIPAR